MAEADEEKKLKVLVVGDVGGKFDKFAKKLKALQKSAAGPFDFVLCVGNFFARPSGAELAQAASGELRQSIAEQQLSSILDGSLLLPVPVYFIAGPDEDAYLPGTRERLAPNLNYLGRQGIATLRGKLTVAYFSGRFGGSVAPPPLSSGQTDEAAAAGDASPFHRDTESLVATWASDYSRGVDILLTNEWPAGALNCVPKELWPKSPAGRPFQLVGAPRVAEIAKLLKPRYHVAGIEDQYWARPPYKNRLSEQDYSVNHVTRFVALASAFNAAKSKFVFAVNVTPIAHMSQETLLAQPEGTTDSPFIGVGTEAVADALKQHQKAAPVQGGSKSGPRRMTGFVAASGSSTPSAGPSKAGPAGVGAAVAGARAVGAPTADTFRGARATGPRAAGPGSLLPLPNIPPPPPPSATGFSRWSTGGGDSMGSRTAGHQRRAGGQRKPGQHNRDHGQPAACWFCLSSPEVKKHMVVSVGSHFYLALAKGGLVPEHLLIVPVKHVTAVSDLESEASGRRRHHHQSTDTAADGDGDARTGSSVSDEEQAAAQEALDELASWKAALYEYFQSMEREVVFFERHVASLNKPMHMHIQVVPLPTHVNPVILENVPATPKTAPVKETAADGDEDGNGNQDDPAQEPSKPATVSVNQAWIQLSKLSGIEFQTMEPGSLLSDATPVDAAGYFVADFPSCDHRLLHVMGDGGVNTKSGFPLQFGRMICSKLLEMPDRVNWRNCDLSKEEETVLAKRIRKEFKPFDNFMRKQSEPVAKKQKT